MTDGNFTTIVVFGASGDLAKKKTYPALFSLFHLGLLPAHTNIIGYSRSEIALHDFHGRLKSFIKADDEKKKESLEKFLKQCTYVAGAYDNDESFKSLAETIHKEEGNKAAADRLFYMALPPSVFTTVAAQISKHLTGNTGYNRCIVEKPFGRDLESANAMSKELLQLFPENNIYRIDHYLGKEMVKNILVIRFANVLFSSIWNRFRIQSVQITFKEPFGTEGRAFDDIGIIRDVMQNHLLQVLTVVAMETPASLKSDDIRDEKVKVLKAIAPIELSNVVVGQYTASADGKQAGYKDDAGANKDSITPTFATAVMYVNNERWDGVPFILRCGKGLTERKAEIRIQLRDMPGNIFPAEARNELVFRVQPDEAVYCKVLTKKPGLTNDLMLTDLDLSYKHRFDVVIPEAYESLIYDALNGDRANFVRTDELQEAWRIFTPLLHRLEREHIVPEPYPFGSRGPKSSDDLIEHAGYKRPSIEYVWKEPKCDAK